MKKTIYLMLLVAGTTFLVSACKDRASEKRIAELESRLSQLESGKTNATAQPTTTAPATQPDVKPDGPLPTAAFEVVDHDFGSVNEGQKVSYTYRVKNTGQAPLIIQNAQPSCGCTVPKWTKEPIPVGGTGEVTAEFDTNGKPGVNNKTITVTSNTWPTTTMLRFKAMVIPRAQSTGPTK